MRPGTLKPEAGTLRSSLAPGMLKPEAGTLKPDARLERPSPYASASKFPAILALLERVFLVLDGAAPSLFQLCGVVPYYVGMRSRIGGRLFGIFLICIVFVHTND